MGGEAVSLGSLDEEMDSPESLGEEAESGSSLDEETEPLCEEPDTLVEELDALDEEPDSLDETETLVETGSPTKETVVLRSQAVSQQEESAPVQSVTSSHHPVSATYPAYKSPHAHNPIHTTPSSSSSSSSAAAARLQSPSHPKETCTFVGPQTSSDDPPQSEYGELG